MKRLTLRSVSLILAVAMVMVLVPTVHAYTSSNWAKAEIDAMAELELIPEDLMDADLTKSIDRMDMCRIAVRTYESVTGLVMDLPEDHPFTDTTDPDAEKAYVAGLVKGNGDGTFAPDKTLERAEYFAFVSQFLTAVGYDAQEGDYADLEIFADYDELPLWVRQHARLAVGLGIVKGSDNKLDWQSLTTGEEALAMFYRTYNVVAPEEELPEEQPPAEEAPGEDLPAEEELIPFPDGADWAMESLIRMDEMGLVPDDVKYSVMSGSITRGDMCRIAVLSYESLFGDVELHAESPFTDTEDPDIILANRLGIVNGYTDGTFKPNDPISRQDFFKIAANFLGVIGYPNSDNPNVNLKEYRDSDELSGYAIAPARLLIGIGAVKGDTAKYLHPNAKIVCQEAIVIFCRVLDYVNQWQENPDSPLPEEPSLGKQVVELALRYEGYRYVYGGKKPETGFDCSGFVYYVYQQFGYDLKPGCTRQWNDLPSTIIPKNELELGDLVFFAGIDSTPGDYDHVGIYIGDGKFIHASTSRTGVIISSLSESFYVRHYAGAKRAIN